MTDIATTEAEFDAARYKADYLAACELVAAMHKAAVGETRGPIRGVVEDVADVRTALDRAREWLSSQDHPGLTGGELVDLAAALRTP